MVEADSVNVTFTADDKDANAKFDSLERRILKAQEQGKKGGKAAGSAFFGGFAGGAFGAVAGAALQSGPVNAITDLLSNVLGAVLLPALQALLPMLEKLGSWAATHGSDAKALGLGGLTAWAVGGPEGLALGGVVAAGSEVKDSMDARTAAEKAKRAKDAQYDAYQAYINKAYDDTPWYGKLSGNVSGLSDYDEYVSEKRHKRDDPGSLMDGPYTYTDPKNAPQQEAGRPYAPDFPPPNIGDLHGPTVVNTG